MGKKMTAAERMQEKLNQAGSKVKNTSFEKSVESNPVVEKDPYYDYQDMFFSATMNGDKYRLNSSVNEETMKKYTYLLFKGGYNSKEKSMLVENSLDIIYELYYEILSKSGQNILHERLSPTEILRRFIELNK